MKKDSQVVLKCIPLSATTVQRLIEEEAMDVEKTMTSEVQQCKFAIPLDKSTFGSFNLFMANVRFHSASMNDTIDEFQFANYREIDTKDEKKIHVWKIIYTSTTFLSGILLRYLLTVPQLW